VTMADEGRELKLWDCTTWSCLQTITLAACQSVPVHFQVMPFIKAQLDPSACYLVLSDIRRKVCCCNIVRLLLVISSFHSLSDVSVHRSFYIHYVDDEEIAKGSSNLFVAINFSS